MTSTAAPADDIADRALATFADLFATPVERPGACLYAGLVRLSSVEGVRIAVAAAADKIAKRLDGVEVTTYVDPITEPMRWCATHRGFTRGGEYVSCPEGPSPQRPDAAPCYSAPVQAADVEVRAEGLPLFDGHWAVGGLLSRDVNGAVIAMSVGVRHDDEMWARRHVALMGECVHCGLSRNRKATILLVDTETGEVRPVGKTCLTEYTGGAIRVELLAALTGLAERFATAVGGVLDSEPDSAPTLDIVALAMRYIAIEGFVKVNDGGMNGKAPTAHNVRAALGYTVGNRPPVTVADLTANDRLIAAGAITDMLDTTGDNDRDRESSYLADLREVASLEWAQWNGSRNRVGLLASLPTAVARRREALARQAAPAVEDTRANAYLGQPGERSTWLGTLVSAMVLDTEFGTTDLVIIDTPTGTLKVFGKARGIEAFLPGSPIEITGTVAERNAHEEYKGHRQTRISRVKITPPQG